MTGSSLGHRSLSTCIAFVALIALGAALAACDDTRPPSPSNTASNTPIYSELSADDAARLDAQRYLVTETLRERYGEPGLDRTAADLPLLQRILDDGVFDASQTYELQCLGVAFGDVLVSEYGYHWTIVTDEFGTDPVLRFEDTVLQANPLTMISKRVERGETVDMEWLYRTARYALDQVPDRAD